MGKKKQKQKEKKFNTETDTEFDQQLRKVGLTIKTILGDGNCLFRSLGDQLEGHSRNHMQIRLQVVDYIKNHREDFEPFIEDDLTFDDHVASLCQNGSYGGNDSIVAFSRLHSCTVYIHQFNTPAFVIHSKGGKEKDIHLSYHNGDHYNSVIKLQSNVNNQVSNQENGANSLEKTNSSGKSGVNKSNSNANRKQKNSNNNNNNTNNNPKTGTMNKKSPIVDDPHIENLKIDETTCTESNLDDNSEKENTSTGNCTTATSKQKPLSRRQKLEQKKKARKNESLHRKRGTFDEKSNGHHHDSLFNASSVKTLSI